MSQEIDDLVKAVREEGDLSQRTYGIGRSFGEHVAKTLMLLESERDRLAAENADLKRRLDVLLQLVIPWYIATQIKHTI